MSALATQTPYTFDYRRSPDQDKPFPVRHPVIVVGAGPVGLVAAIDLAQRGVPTILLDDAGRIGEGSRAICFAKRTIEIFDRLGVGDRMMAKGVTWKAGKIFRGNDLVSTFDLLPEPGHRRPAFINLQQYYVEQYLVDAAQAIPEVDLRWRNKITSVTPLDDGVRLTIETPDGAYDLEADWVVAADGVRSTVRGCLGLEFAGQSYADRFLIVDVEMNADFPPERWFWFEPPFHSGPTALLHKQPDDVWRIDFQLPWDCDPEFEKRPDVVIPRIERMLGHRDFAIKWISVYTFHCRRLERFVHGRIIFAGDAAHQVTPLGARGANSGIQDAENIAWKLARVIAGSADQELVETYDIERSAAADENILRSSSSAEFIMPKSKGERDFRDAVLNLAPAAPFARRMINAGRLSTPSTYDTPLSTPDLDVWQGSAQLGAPVPDAPLKDTGGRSTWLLDVFRSQTTLLCVEDDPVAAPSGDLAVITLGGALLTDGDFFQKRFDPSPGAAYLVRPDQHLAARWREYDATSVTKALARLNGGLRC
jgi:3-(3-hydroxy-phenyl)propionate hydroxylase